MEKKKSDSFSLRPKRNVTIYAIAESDDHKRCIITKFSSSPELMIHCEPPKNVHFQRSSGQMRVTAEWDNKVSHLERYSLKYKETNTTKWKVVQLQNSKDYVVWNLTSSVSYEMQLQCLTRECPHCPPGEVIRVPQELLGTPDIKEVPGQSHFIHSGQRIVIITWEYVDREAVESYNVTIQKASGEPAVISSYFLQSPTVTLVLCYSAYNISISAFNKAGSSPAAHVLVDDMEDKSDWGVAFNVTMNSNDSFNLSWNSSLSEKYHCYLVEWWEMGEKPKYMSFYQKKSYHEVRTENALFQPYKRYHFLLHVRPYKDTCNLKDANNSEHTYGRTQAYLLEGTPSAAPGNVSIYNITHSSFVITWNPVSEVDLRGFLQGYIIRYINVPDQSGKHVTVEPSVSSYKLLNLKSRTMYSVQLSAYTAAGEGLSNEPLHIDTKPLDSMSMDGMLAGVIGGIITLLLAVHFCCRFLQRSKNWLWPSVPNPCKSNAVQKIDGGQELEMLEPLHWQNLEGTETSVCVVEGTEASLCVADRTEASLCVADRTEASLCVADRTEASLCVADRTEASLCVADRTEASLCVVEFKECPATCPSLTPRDFLKATLIPVIVTESTDDTLIGEPTEPHAASTITDSTANEVFPIDGNTEGSALTPPTDAINTMNTSNTRGTDDVLTVKPNVPIVSDYTTMELFQQISRIAVQSTVNKIGCSETAPSNPEDYMHQALTYTEDLQQ
ncbi:interleukin-31 receptor subunit alpha isoform X2 [Electrophorus electricus]|nr:interleukin-31 receptor subunit alpha isoform X2 [Electrophorus electricus]